MTDTHSASAKEPEVRTGPPFTPKPPFFFELSRLMVVAIMGSRQLVYKAQTKPNGPWEANWTPIDTSQTYGIMAAGLTGDGRVAVVAQPASAPGAVYIDEKPNTPTQQWNPPFNLGKPPAATAFIHLSTAFDADGRVEVFGTDTNNAIWWRYHPPYFIDIIAFSANS